MAITKENIKNSVARHTFVDGFDYDPRDWNEIIASEDTSDILIRSLLDLANSVWSNVVMFNKPTKRYHIGWFNDHYGVLDTLTCLEVKNVLNFKNINNDAFFIHAIAPVNQKLMLWPIDALNNEDAAEKRKYKQELRSYLRWSKINKFDPYNLDGLY